MTQEMAVDLIQQAMWTAMLLGAPIMTVALCVGLVVSILQAATQINEMTLTFIPKIVAVGGTIWFTGSWMLNQWLTYTIELINSMSSLP